MDNTKKSKLAFFFCTKGFVKLELVSRQTKVRTYALQTFADVFHERYLFNIIPFTRYHDFLCHKKY